MRKLDINDVAEICHEVNRSICEAAGDMSQKPWSEAEEWQRVSAIDGVAFVRANPDAGADASHVNWMRHKIEDGWIFGTVKDPEAKTHPCLVPYSDLPFEQRVKDHTFRAIVQLLG